MDEEIKQLLSIFDWQYILSVNILTYVSIKTIDELNKEKKVSYTVKLITAVICALLVSILLVKLGIINPADCVHNFILSLVSWDYIVKPLLRVINKKLDYKNYGKKDD